MFWSYFVDWLNNKIQFRTKVNAPSLKTLLVSKGNAVKTYFSSLARCHRRRRRRRLHTGGGRGRTCCQRGRREAEEVPAAMLSRRGWSSNLVTILINWNLKKALLSLEFVSHLLHLIFMTYKIYLWALFKLGSLELEARMLTTGRNHHFGCYLQSDQVFGVQKHSNSS